MPDVETRYGLLEVPDGEADVIGQFLVRYGEWAWLETMFVGSVLPANPRVLDAGAFIGTFGLGLAKTHELAFLCCVEACRDVVPLLERNILKHAKCPAVVVPAVLAGNTAAVFVGAHEPGNLGSMSFSVAAGDGAAPSGLPGVTLGALREQHGPFDLVKLDLEGMELEVLQSDPDHLAQHKTTIWLECNEGPRSLEVAALVLSWGVPVYYFAFPSYHRENFNGDPEAIFPWAYEAGLLVAPSQPPSLTPELARAGCILVAIRSDFDLRDALWRTPRWGRTEWAQAETCPELAALVGRSLRGETVAGFLEGGPKTLTVWEQLDQAGSAGVELRRLLEEERIRTHQLDTGLQEASALALNRLDQVAAECRRREAAERGLREAQDLALDRLALLEQARGRIAELETERRERQAVVCQQAATMQRLENELARASSRVLVHLAAAGELRDREAGRQAEQVQWRDRAAAQARAQEAVYDERMRALEIEGANQVRAEMQRVGALMAAQIDAIQGRVEAAEQRASGAETALLVMRASTIWRAASPIRVAVHQARHWKSRMRLRATAKPSLQ